MSIFSLIVVALFLGPSGEGLTLPATVDSTEVRYRGERDGPRCEKYDASAEPPIDFHEMSSFEEAEACIFRWLEESRDIDEVVDFFEVIVNGQVGPTGVIPRLIDRVPTQMLFVVIEWAHSDFPFPWATSFSDALFLRLGSGPYAVNLEIAYFDDGTPRWVKIGNIYK